VFLNIVYNIYTRLRLVFISPLQAHRSKYPIKSGIKTVLFIGSTAIP